MTMWRDGVREGGRKGRENKRARERGGASSPTYNGPGLPTWLLPGNCGGGVWTESAKPNEDQQRVAR